jgi:SAM-dependent methyltransferase
LTKAIPMTLVLALLSPGILTLWLGHVDRDVLMIQRIALFAVLFDAAGNGVLYFVWWRGAIRQVLIACVAKAVLGLALTGIFVFAIGPVGAALALLCSFAAVSLWLSTQIPAILPRPRSGFSAITDGFVLPGLLAAAMIILIQDVLPRDALPRVVIGGAFGIGVFLLVFFIAGAHEEERTLATAMLRPWRRRLRAITPLRSLWHLFIELAERLSGRWRHGIAGSAALFEAGSDPWAYRDSRHQQRFERAEAMVRKALGLLGGRIRTALEIACAEGHFTERLAPLCDSLTAVDASDLALERNRLRVQDRSNVIYLRRDILAGELPVNFDLVIADGILDYFRSRTRLKLLRRKLKGSVRPGGYLLLGNVRQHEIIETARWARWLVRGGVNVNEFVAHEPGFEIVESDVDDFYAYHLVRRQ